MLYIHTQEGDAEYAFCLDGGGVRRSSPSLTFMIDCDESLRRSFVSADITSISTAGGECHISQIDSHSFAVLGGITSYNITLGLKDGDDIVHTVTLNNISRPAAGNSLMMLSLAGSDPLAIAAAWR